MESRLEVELSGLGLDASQRRACDQLDKLLDQWSAAIRLVGFVDRKTRLHRYFLDPLRFVSCRPNLAQATQIVDIGSGGGTPALPMAVALPTVQFHLIEANRRKSIFLNEAVESLGLTNVRVTHGRYEQSLRNSTAAADAVTVRGVAVDETFHRIALSITKPGGALYWLTSKARADSHRWGTGWDKQTSLALSDEDQSPWLAWAVRAYVSRET